LKDNRRVDAREGLTILPADTGGGLFFRKIVRMALALPLAEMVTQKLIWIEWLMVAVFIFGSVAWGFFMHKGTATLEGSFLAGRKVPGFLASLSTVATNLNANDFIGAAGFTYGVGVVLAHQGYANAIALILVSLFLVQKLRRINVFTLGEWLDKRYSRTVGTMYSATWCLVWMLFNLGLYLYAGALVLNTLVGWDLYYSIVVLSVVAALITLSGGYAAVVATDVLQISLMFLPFVFLSVGVLTDIGGVSGLAARLPADKGIFWTNTTPFGGLVMMVMGAFFMGLSYWSSEAQVIQRPLSARSEEDAVISYLGATFWFSILFPLVVTLPALAAICYFPDLAKGDLAMPSMIRKFIPRGLYGVTVVGLMAGVFSSVDAQINSFCTMFTTDIYRKLLQPHREEKHYLIVSRASGVVFTLAAIGTALLFSRRNEGMMLFAISVLATIMPPFAAVIILGAMAHRMNRTGALAGLIAGGATAVGLIIADKLGSLSTIAENALFFRTTVTFLVSLGVTALVSMFTGHPLDEQRPRMDISVTISPRVLRMAIILLLALAGMVVFWSHYFRAHG
jgi:solute:Na+ symporter, SSS family